MSKSKDTTAQQIEALKARYSKLKKKYDEDVGNLKRGLENKTEEIQNYLKEQLEASTDKQTKINTQILSLKYVQIVSLIQRQNQDRNKHNNLELFELIENLNCIIGA